MKLKMILEAMGAKEVKGTYCSECRQKMKESRLVKNKVVCKHCNIVREVKNK